MGNVKFGSFSVKLFGGVLVNFDYFFFCLVYGMNGFVVFFWVNYFVVKVKFDIYFKYIMKFF